VNLEMIGNTLVKATITNNGGSDLKLFKIGSLLDPDIQTEKAEILSLSFLEFRPSHYNP
jgi:deuterolysin